ncbi:MAG: RDD family protein [Chloracidobacterium sp.]|nr:RDD family protein [Chloracidobacterium sp.]
MMNDSVREDLESKITSGRLVPKQIKAKSAPQPQPVRASQPLPPPPVKKKTVTANLVTHKTSQTLVEFQNKNSAMPDWRIQLQNAVQQRKGGRADDSVTAVSESEVQHANHGNLALKTEPVRQPEMEASPNIGDPRVANAMRRINESRNTFFQAPAKTMKAAPTVQSPPVRPFGVVSPSGNTPTFIFGTPQAKLPTLQKPKLVMSPVTVAEKRDTNKLPKIELPAESKAAVEQPLIARVEKLESGPISLPFPESTRIHITAENVEIDELDSAALDADDIEDLAPFSMRFGAGLFDFIIGGFTTMLVLSPLAFTSSNWFTAGSFLTFTGTWAIVMFVYMTACLGFFGKTMGMRMFQLELVDAIENEYPTLRQAAVNSSVFLVSIMFAGAPFLTVYFNEERRALHDLLSGTILVREF